MKKYAKTAAIALALAIGGATAALAQVGVGRPLEPTYNDSTSVVAGHARYDTQLGLMAPDQCANELNAARSPATRYPVPDACSNI